MSLATLLDRYELRSLPNGTLLRFAASKLDDATDVRECLRDIAVGSTLFLDFTRVEVVGRAVWDDLIALQEELSEHDQRLCLLNLTPRLRDQLHAVEDGA